MNTETTCDAAVLADADNYNWLRNGGWEVLQDPKYWLPEYRFDGAVAAARTDVALNRIACREKRYAVSTVRDSGE